MKRFFYSFIRLFVYWLIGLLAFSLTALPARAQENWVDSDYARCLEAAEGGEVCKSAYASSVQSDLQADLVRKILGPVPGVTVTADAWQRNPEYVRKMAAGAAVPQIGSFIAMMYANPPADLALWIRDTGESLGFIPKQAYAQGIGFSGLAPLLPIWKAFRNIAYFLLAIILVIIGFMVMLRKKIDPKTVVTVQNALPKIVVTLLLITFSYAMVGVMIDLMYLLLLIAVGVLQSTKLLPDPTWLLKTVGYESAQGLYSQGGLLANLTNIFGVGTPFGSFGGLTTPTNLSWQALGIDPNVGKWGIGAGSLLLGIVLVPFTGPWGLLAAAPFGGQVLISMLIAIAVALLAIRLFWFFVSTYIQIVLALLFSPLQLLSEAIPGSSVFSNWIRGLFSNLIVFPVAGTMFMLSGIFVNMANQATGDLWAPPFMTITPFSSIRSIGALLSLGVLFYIPTIAGQIKEALKPKPFIAAGPEAIAGTFAQPFGMLMQGYQLWVSHQSMQAFRGLAGLTKGEKPR